MAKKKTKAARAKKAIDHYTHADKKRLNNPPVDGVSVTSRPRSS